MRLQIRKFGSDAASFSAITELTSRLKHYVVVQTVTRIGATWYQLQYGFGSTYDSNEATTMQTVSVFFELILTPAAGVGYLVVFLCIQPEAWNRLKSACCCCCYQSASPLGAKANPGGSFGADGASNLQELRATFASSDGYRDQESDDPRLSRDGSTFTLLDVADMDEDDLALAIDRAYFVRARANSLSVDNILVTPS
jgi:hypothetical protein